MLRLTPRLWLAIGLAIASAASGRATDRPERPAVEAAVEVKVVELSVGVFDRRGRCVRGLDRGRFVVEEEGVRQEITHFAGGTDTNLDIAFLFDVSGSMAQDHRLEWSVWAAKVFFRQLRPGDRAAVLAFADAGLETLVGFCPTAEEADAAVGRLYAYGKTALADALTLLPAQLPRREEAAAAAVLFTDGLENASRMTLEQALHDAAASAVPIYLLGFPRKGPTPDEGGNGLELLERIAEVTGGRFTPVLGPADLHRAMRLLEHDLRCTYELGYYAKGQVRAGTYRRLQVSVAGGVYRVRARAGYVR